MTLSTKPEVHNIATLPKYDRLMGKVDTDRQFGEVWPCGFSVMRADRETDVLIATLRTRPGAK